MAGYTQEEMAMIINTSREMFNYCENGRRDFTKSQEKLIYEKLKLKIPSLTMEELFPIDEG